jgi:hypothetical protein
MDGFVSGATFGYDGNGSQRAVDLLSCGDDILEDEGRKLRLEVVPCRSIRPPGLPMCSWAIAYRCAETGKWLIIVLTSLWENQQGRGTHMGIGIDSVYEKKGGDDLYWWTMARDQCSVSV